jgi:glycosyltransferase involved in cell wall biosynthesis
MQTLKKIKISVAMTTFNGENFLEAQLNSLKNQTWAPLELVVGDDGSTDKTIEILINFRQHATFPVRIIHNETKLGYSQNFLSTARQCTGPWIAFCDQDDVWLPDKLADAADAIANTPGCNMVLQNAYICDEELNHNGRVFPGNISTGVKKPFSQYGFWVWPGFLKTIPRKMIDAISENDPLPLSWYPDDGKITHDKLTCIIANAVGGIVVLGKPSALYRRHLNALTGNYAMMSSFERISQSLKVCDRHYDYLAKVAAQISKYFELLSKNLGDDIWVSSLKQSSYNFKKISKIQSLRSCLYRSNKPINRLLFMLKILTANGYFGTRFTAMGISSAGKDFMRILKSYQQ